MDRLLQDFRYAVRSLLGSPLLTAASVLSLALGIGASTAIFSAVDTFMLKPLEFPDSDRLVVVWTSDGNRGGSLYGSSPLDFADWRRESTTLDLAAHNGAGVNVGTGDEAVRLSGREVTPGFFRVLGVSPAQGRAFLPEEELEGSAPVAILSHEVWVRNFGADPSLLGSTVTMDGVATEIVGIMPEGFVFGTPQDLFVPLRLQTDIARDRRWLDVLGRVREGTDLDGARRELSAVASRLAQAYPETNDGMGVGMLRLQEDWFDEGFREGSLISSAAVLFVLLIACANVANLLLARGADREREIALRSALGAGRGTILRQLLTESLLLALVGGLLGVGVGYLGVEGIRGLFPPFLPGVNRLALDERTLLFTGVATVVSGLLFGLLPALRSSRTDLRGTLTDGGRGGTAARGGKLRSGLVMAEVGLSAVLLISSVLLVKSFALMRTQPVGYDVEGVVSMRLTLPEVRYPTVDEIRTFQNELLERVRGLPGVESAALTHIRPMWGNTQAAYALPGEARPEPGREPVVNVRQVSPGHWETLGIPLTAGRPLEERDQPDTPPVVVVSEGFARRHWEGAPPVGERVELWGTEHEIVGVVADTREWGPTSSPVPMAYVPLTQRPHRSPFLLVRTGEESAAVGEAVRRVVRGMDPEQAVYELASMEQVLDEQLSGNMAMVKVLGTLGLVAFLLSAMGVYGVMAYSVSRRTHEMGIRQSLGADRAAVRNLVVRQGLTLAGVGIVVGVLLALGTTRGLAFFLYGVSPFDLMAFLSVPGILLVTGAAASWIPAVRATRVDPMVALRGD